MARLPSRPNPNKRKASARFSPEYGILLELLIELRLKAGVTQQQVADKVGKTQAHISLWERREREIGVVDACKWCEAVGIGVSEFFTLFEERIEKL